MLYLWTLCISSLQKCLFRSLTHLFFLNITRNTITHFLIGLLVFLEWSHVSYLYILEVKHLLKVSFANMFCHLVGSLFILLMCSSAVQKLFILIDLFVYSFLYVPWSRGYISENIAAWNIWDCPALFLL